jgi:hypothetical protein
LGRRSKFALTSAAILSSAIFPVPSVYTVTLIGSATPIAYESWTWHCRAMPAATMFLAT